MHDPPRNRPFSPIPANGNGEGTSEDTGTIRDSGGGICDLRYGRKDLQRPAPSLPAWRRQCLVVYCNGRCTGAAGRRTRPHPAFWELRSLPRIYEVINEIKNAAGKRKKSNKNEQFKTKLVEPGQVLAPCSLDSISLYWSCGKCQE